MPKILIIDDEAPLRMLISTALQGKGYTVFEAESGASGIQTARNHSPDLILCDVMMPDMDGFATLQALRQDPVTAVTPCILMTGQPNNEGMRYGMVMGADDYLPKPFTIAELKAAVEARLKKHQVLQKQAEKKLADLRDNLTLALPHELFTPLSGILGFAEIIINDAAILKPDDLAEIGHSIQISAKRLNRLVENFLIYAQIELLAGDPVKIDLLRQGPPTVIDYAFYQYLQEQAQKAKRLSDLKLDLIPGSAVIQEGHLKKIFEELLDNAFKFSDHGSLVGVSSRNSPEGVTFMVSDHGHGMSAEHIANIGAYMQFERKIYEQQGSGLGLAIANSLAQIHGGSLTIQSQPEQGTTVTVFLPKSIPPKRA